MNKFCFALIFIACFLYKVSYAFQSNGDTYEIKVYNLNNDTQVQRVDAYLKEAYIPALHKAGIAKVGVFKPIANDTAAIKKIYLFIPFHSLSEWSNINAMLQKNKSYTDTAYTKTRYNNPAYNRIETILLDAFSLHKHYELPGLKNSSTDKIYELRSYESASEKLYDNKVQMFNEGGEIALFKRLNFNAVFYARVLAGSHQPNLMYMTSFENMAERDAHWKAFFDAPEWKKLIADPQYQNNVSHADIILMHATDYSDM